MREEVLLIGNPNTGKTTLFNTITKSEEHTGNWHGVTVDMKKKDFSVESKNFTLVDLPGIYSLTYLSFEEKVTTEYLRENLDKKVIYICDENNLKHNLFLALELLEVGLNFVIFINNFGSKIKKDFSYLEKKLGVKIVYGNAEKIEDVRILKSCLKIISAPKNLPCYVNEKLYEEIKNEYKPIYQNKQELLYFCKNIVEKTDILQKNEEKSRKISENLENKLNKFSFETLSKERYNLIHNILKTQNKKVYGKSKLDKIFLNKYLSIPIFFGLLLVVFYLTFFSFGAFLSSVLRYLIQDAFGEKLVGFVSGLTSVTWVVDLVQNGIVGGIGSLVAFLPQTILLFFFLSLIEDSGYMSRIAFLFEDIFSKVGLSGKSVYTLLMAFGCSTTATLTARNMEDKSAKIKTAMLTPYMSCSAKLPIYAVIGGAFFGASNVFIIFMLYCLGIVCALIVSMLMEKTSLKTKEQSFILEFPAYRIPSIKKMLKNVWQNTKLFLQRVGTLLISVNVIVWTLQSFSFNFAYVNEVGGNSMLKSLGEIFAPIFVPLGFGSWGAVSALFAGIIAKEIIISSIAMFNGINAKSTNFTEQTSNSIKDFSAVVFFSPASAISYMVFCLLYFPCLSTISVFSKEIGKKWTFVSVCLQFLIAYVVSFVVFRAYLFVESFGITNALWVIFAIILIFVCSCYVTQKIRKKNLCLMCSKQCHKRK